MSKTNQHNPQNRVARAAEQITRPTQQPGQLEAYTYQARAHASVRTQAYLFNQLIPYIGNKRKLLPPIAAAIERTGLRAGVFVDCFAGSGVVSRLAKLYGFRLIANDWEPYTYPINLCYIACNQAPSFPALGGIERAFQQLNQAQPIEGYIARHLCPHNDEQPDPDRERMFFTRANGMKIDAMREQIENWWHSGAIDDDERAILIAALLYAVTYVSNTSGVFKGFHRGWGGQTGTALYRILSAIELRPPVFYDNHQPNQVCTLDAQALAEQLAAEQLIDIAYLDPPYNQHPYASNYHVLNTVTLWDEPPVSPAITGRNKSAIRTDWRVSRRSAFNYASAPAAYRQLLQTLRARFIITSYSTDGNIPLAELLDASASRGRLSCITNSYKRYRVSTQRMSPKPLNVEFVLIIDTAGTATRAEVEAIERSIRSTEQAAIAAHGQHLR